MPRKRKTIKSGTSYVFSEIEVVAPIARQIVAAGIADENGTRFMEIHGRIFPNALATRLDRRDLYDAVLQRALELSEKAFFVGIAVGLLLNPLAFSKAVQR